MRECYPKPIKIIVTSLVRYSLDENALFGTKPYEGAFQYYDGLKSILTENVIFIMKLASLND